MEHLEGASADIHWERVAEPQCDEYDTELVLSWARSIGLTMPSIPEDEPKLAGTVLSLQKGLNWDRSRYADVEPSDPKLIRGVELLQTWPVGYTQVLRLLTAVYAVSDLTAPPNVWGGSSGSGPLGFGTVAATVDSPVGFAQAVVHEMAHHKLRGLGVEFLSATNLITNNGADLFRSPIRYDSHRPMTAVVHAQYSFTYVTVLNIHIVRAAHVAKADKDVALYFLARHLPKLEFGLDEISRYMIVDQSGRRFFEGYYRWFSHIRNYGHETLTEYSVAPVPFVHPLG